VPNIKDTDFLYISALVREKENQLISAEQLDRMVRAESDADAAKILEECGYGHADVSDAAALDRTLMQKVTAIFQELADRGPDPRVVDAFRIEYDYHNAKVLIHAEVVDVDGDRLMSDSGRIPRLTFEQSYYGGLTSGVPELLATATLAARQILIDTGDARAVDILLDRAMYREYLDFADAIGDAFFSGYVRLSIDGANLRTAVRAVRMKLGPDLLLDALIPGGDISPERVIKATDLKRLYVGTPLEAAARLAPGAMEGGDLIAFERTAANALFAYLKQAKFTPFGIAPVVAYMAALEAEARAVRIVMAGRGAGLTPEAIRERLRD